ncbi:MAG: alpha/beta hydrolase [Bacteroidota bacterium]
MSHVDSQEGKYRILPTTNELIAAMPLTIKRSSHFKDPETDRAWFLDWVQRLESLNQHPYEQQQITSSLGITHVWGLNWHANTTEALVIFPGARTTALIWDLDNGLGRCPDSLSIYLVETNGLPNLSDGHSPDIKSSGYGMWATEVLDALGLDKVHIAGASFGGLICMKLALVSPERIKKAILLNPGCLQFFSLTIKNLFYNLLPILLPSPRHISSFLDAAVFCKPTHRLSPEAEQLLLEYQYFAITRYKDRSQKPYDMDKELYGVKVDTYLLLGENDLLFPYRKSLANAEKKLSHLKEVHLYEQVGHGIETYPQAIDKMIEIVGQV